MVKMKSSLSLDHMLGDPNFRVELQKGYLQLNFVREQCMDAVTNYFDNSRFQNNGDGDWSNEYGYYLTDFTIEMNEYEKTLVDMPTKTEFTPYNFFVSVHQIGTVLFYKILPLDATQENCEFLSNPRNFDGYFEFKEKYYLDYEKNVDEDPQLKCSIPWCYTISENSSNGLIMRMNNYY